MAAARPSGIRARLALGASLVSLGASLARRGFLSVAAMVISALTVLALVGLAAVLATRSANAPVHDVPILASSALAWGGGFLHAFSASAHALRRDRSEGIRDLLHARTKTTRGYLVARIGGLAAILAVTLGGGTLLCGLAATLLAARVSSVPMTLQATLASVVFAVAFAVVIAPVAVAAVGARSRLGGYTFLMFVIVLPELLSGALSSVLPASVTEVLAIPSALGALRSALAPGGFEVLRAVRALVALGLYGAFAVFLVEREVALLEHQVEQA